MALRDIRAARRRIGSAVFTTPCHEAPLLSALAGMELFCKYENLQRTGSFKERGARNALSLLGRDQRKNGVLTASTGSHALGLAYHARQMGVPVTVVLSESTPEFKRRLCAGLGAEVRILGATYCEAVEEARALARRQDKTFVPAADDPAIIAGHGTVGLEILDQVAAFDAIVIPIGAGGFIAGVATAIKALRPRVRVIGVEPERAACWTAAARAGQPVTIDLLPTVADGLAVNRAGDHAFAVARGRIDAVVTVSEDELCAAIHALAERAKCVVEGAGAAPLAACLGGRLPELQDKRVVLPLGGGNIDPARLAEVLCAAGCCKIKVRTTGP